MKVETEEGVFSTSEDLHTFVERRYQQPAWTVLGQVRDGTGFDTRGRSADAIAFGTWPSRGLKILGFEYKSYRSDWLRELKNPEKAEAFANFCDEWWLITGSDGVAKLEEIPLPWGWAVGTNKGLITVKEPVAKKANPISRIFLMSIMRNVAKSYVPAAQLEKLVEKKMAVFKEKQEKSRLYDQERAANDFERLKKQVKEFEAASGIEINSWCNGKEIGEVVKAVMDSRLKWNIQTIQETGLQCQQLLEKLAQIEIFREKSQ